MNQYQQISQPTQPQQRRQPIQTSSRLVKVRLYLKVLLNGEFKPLFLKKKYPNKEQYYNCLRECIVKIMIKLFYPYNVDINYKDSVKLFNMLTISRKKGILLYLECDLNMPVKDKKINNADIEKNIRVYNIHPTFFKYVRLIKHKVLPQ